MTDERLKDLWVPSFDVLYDACFYELASERIIETWYWIDLAVSVFTAVAVLGSAVTGWMLWSNPNGKVVWGCFCASAFGFVILHTILAVPTRIRLEGERRQLFSAIRIDLQLFRASLHHGVDASKANKRLAVLRERLSNGIAKTPPDIVFTHAVRHAVQFLVNEKLKKFIDAASPTP